jgi:hypothetical protein
MKTSWSAASEFCCSIGMKLLTVESFGMRDCIHRTVVRMPFACKMMKNILDFKNIQIQQ